MVLKKYSSNYSNITITNKFNITNYIIKTKNKKNTTAVKFEPASMQSNITECQFSPVAHAISKRSEFKKFLKFFSSLNIVPVKYDGPEKRY